MLQQTNLFHVSKKYCFRQCKFNFQSLAIIRKRRIQESGVAHKASATCRADWLEAVTKEEGDQPGRRSCKGSELSRLPPAFRFKHAKSVCVCWKVDVGSGNGGGGGDDEERVAAGGHDLEQPFRHQEQPAADHVSRGLAVGHLIRELVVEGVSSFIVVFWSCVAALMQEMHGTLSFPLVCLVVALTVAFVFGWIGPAHFNPAVTATLAAFGYFPWPKLPLYALVQLAGSVLACLSANGVMRPREEHFYGTVPVPAGHTRLPFLLEFCASAVLMVVIATVARSSVSKAVGGLAIGGAVGALGLVIGPVSGGSMNPVRTLGPALVLGRYDSLWIYLVAPVSGMLLGALCNRIYRSSDAVLAFLCGGDAAAALRAKRVLAPRAVGAVVASQHR